LIPFQLEFRLFAPGASQSLPGISQENYSRC
jgi:hypothetical protein